MGGVTASMVNQTTPMASAIRPTLAKKIKRKLMNVLDEVNQMLAYCPGTGEFRWRVSKGRVRAGDVLEQDVQEVAHTDGRHGP